MSFSQFSYRALLSRLGAGILFSIFCVAITQAQNVPPKLTDVSIVSPIGEYGYTTLIGTIQDANPFDKGTLKINWGDGKPTEVYAYFTNVVTFTNYHVYTDRSVTNKPTDKYTV